MTETPKHTPPAGEPRPARPRHLTIRHLDGALRLEAEVSPCVFIYPDYPLQLRVTLRRGDAPLGDAYAVDRSRTAETATEADVRRLLDAVATAPCRRCAAPAFDPATVDTNRAGLCEACFLADLERDLARARDEDRRALEARDRAEEEAGMAFRVNAWVHPAAGGDDFEIVRYFAAPPTEAQVRALLEAEGSCVLDGYRVVALGRGADEGAK